jgi:hypothetical protein
MAPDSPNARTFRASQSKTPQGDQFIYSARPIPPVGLAAVSPLQGDSRPPHKTTPQGDNDMGPHFARKLLLGAAIASSLGIGYAIGAQPHMAETIVILQSARAELVKATPNKGGHRERALGLIDQAIGEVQAGMNFAAQ